MTTAILVLAKAPVTGSVKTRLCPPATARAAADIAAAALLDTLEAAQAAHDANVIVALSGDIGDAERATTLRDALDSCTVFPQRGASFAERIVHAHADAAAATGGAPLLQIGMDTPQVSGDLLNESAARLAQPDIDVTFGHACDGGWWALGLREPGCARLLAGVPTSRADTGRRTEKALREAGLSVALLPQLSDADTVDDAHRVAGLAPNSRFATALAQLP